MTNDQQRGAAGEGTLLESERRTDDRISAATDRISKIEGSLPGFVTYKDILLKFTPIVVGAVGVGATIVLIASRVLE
ncbi:MAG: hypothetical protein OXC56_07160 [Chloroflexi bacterium]|nr:hypothetical protein [Chloroflexota bacterium]